MSNMSQPMQVLTSHESVDWFTPPDLVELVREVLSEITLDPAGHEISQRWIQAKEFWTVGGLERTWSGFRCHRSDVKVFCNPPYGKTGSESNQGLWAKKMEEEYLKGQFSEGILLINSTHGYNWYEDVWSSWPVCLLRARVKFWYQDGVKAVEGGQAKRGQTLVYFGDNWGKFKRVFETYGRVLFP